MSLFRRNRRSKVPKYPFDPKLHKPVVYSSICTGEKRAGFEWTADGRFEEIMCIRSPEDMKAFMEDYKITAAEIETKY